MISYALIHSSIIFLLCIIQLEDNIAEEKCAYDYMFLQYSNSSIRCKRKDQFVDCSHSGLTVIPSNIPNDAVSLDLSANPLDKVAAFPDIRRLRRLRIAKHSLSEVSVNTFRALKALRILDLSSNYLDSVPPNFAPPSLDTLILAGNPLSWPENETKPILRSPSLRTLDLSFCGITSLPKSAFTYLTYLQNLDLSNNFINHLDPDIFSSLSTLITLNISRNLLPRLSNTIFQNNPFLMHVNISYNPWNLNLIEPRNGSTTSFGTTGSSSMYSYNTSIFSSLSLEVLDFSGCWLVKLSAKSLASLPKLRYLSLSDTGLERLDPYSFEQLTNLESLDLSNNRFIYIHVNMFKRNTKLTSFTCSPCSFMFTFLSLFGTGNSMEPYSIKNLNIKGTPFGRIFYNTARFPALTKLQMSDTRISSISPTAFSLSPELTEIDLSDCDIREFPTTVFISNNKLDRIKISGNLLGGYLSNDTRFPFTTATNLDLSDCKYHVISKNYFSELHSIVYLNLSGNPLISWEEGSFSSMTNLQSIDLSRTLLVQLDSNAFIKNTLLKSLFLSNVQLGKVFSKKGLLNSNRSLSHFLHIPSLEELDLSYCDIHHLTKGMFSGTPSLSKLSLVSNGLRSLNVSIISKLSNLTFLDLQDNPWRCDCTLVELRDWWYDKRMEPRKHWVICEEPDELHDRPWDAIADCGSIYLRKKDYVKVENKPNEGKSSKSSEVEVIPEISSTVSIIQLSNTTRIGKTIPHNKSAVIPITKIPHVDSKATTFPPKVTENYYTKHAKPLAIYKPSSSKPLDESEVIMRAFKGVALGFFGAVVIISIATMFFIVYRKKYRQIPSISSCETANTWEL
ncbi:hypothetical protein J437_LFUL014866 [Ladona fulva]|uniref:LRRCT domain-containing protein n=1 Tax=Ladona fulva TaxID=123851 RepID=A0A8K0KGE7_LADFU|nr:hypothetical protein J437_LFUL014866 [Ladona fulva]